MGYTYPYHAPMGDPCTRDVGKGPCGVPAGKHRIDHIPQGDPCTRCGCAYEKHYRKRRKLNTERQYYVGLDGEGQGRDDHRYVLLAWSNERGTRQAWIEAKPGQALTTEECLDFLIRMPIQAKPFAFAFNYDLTKILADVDSEVLWYLFRADQRQRGPGFEKFGPRPVYWRHYKLNIHGSKFSVTDTRTKRKKHVWDVFKFYQSKFTTALEDWYKSTPDKCPRCKDYPGQPCDPCRQWPRAKADIDRIDSMKVKRADFDKEDVAGVRAYCFLECQYMAGLVRKLDEAHTAAGLELKRYDGAGSTARAVLVSMGLDKTSRGRDAAPPFLSPADWKAKRNGPKEMAFALSQAFFGGRFEHSVIGPVEGTIWSYDISSAYPYQLTFLPCIECGTWERTTDRKAMEGATTALVRYSLDPAACPSDMVWGPFPFRTRKGSIAFPSVSGGGWIWREEFLQGERLFPHVRFQEAWVYRTTCKHQPFADIPRLYVERLRIGKEGPGIVIKLGSNACYGRLAQSIGSNPPFQSWIYAGMITSGCRAQELELLGLHLERRNCLAMATDGQYSREKLDPPKPRETVTPEVWEGIAANLRATMPPDKAAREYERTRALYAEKPLGGWERKRIDAGMFFARPGIYFPLNPSKEDIKQIRARGIGRGALYDSWQKCIDAYLCRSQIHVKGCTSGWSLPGPMVPHRGCDCPLGVRISHVDRFHGAKSSIHRVELQDTTALIQSRQFGINPFTGKPRKNPDPYVFKRGAMLDEHGAPIEEDEDEGTLTRKGPVSRYGQWSQRHIDMTFNPLPKREGINANGTLTIRSFPLDEVSAPYKKAIHGKSDDAKALKAYDLMISEQPAGMDFADYERELVDT